jgi:hypothetical protein
MKNIRTWNKEAARGLFRGSEGCSVKACGARPAIAVAGDDSGTTFMCLHHAASWSESSLCRDVAQHNSAASRLALSTWLNIAEAGNFAPNYA